MSQTLRRPEVALPAFKIALVVVCVAFSACAHSSSSSASRETAVVPSSSPLPPEALVPSPRLIVGRIREVDLPLGFAFVELAPDAPPAALSEGMDLVARTLEFRETARLRASRYVRGRTLGAKILSGQPSPGDEVVWQAP